MKRQIAILGSTGSIGTQALQVIKEHPDLYEVYALTAVCSYGKQSGGFACPTGTRVPARSRCDSQ